jgi:hypothetical protein
MYLFSLNKKGTIILHPDAMKLVPFFSELTEEEKLFVVLSTDYYSPYRQLSQDERYRRATAQVFKDQGLTPNKKDNIAKAIKEYESLQFDPVREQLLTYKSKVSKINDAIRNEEDASAIAKLMKTNSEIRKAIAEIEKELSMQDEKEHVQLHGKGTLSLLERLIRNKELYAEKFDNGKLKKDALENVYQNRNYNEPEPDVDSRFVDLEDLAEDEI